MTLVSAANLQVNEDTEFTLGIIGIIITAGLIIQVGGYLSKYNAITALLASAAIFYLSFKLPILMGPYQRIDRRREKIWDDAFTIMETHPYAISALNEDKDWVTVVEFSNSLDEAMARARELNQEEDVEFIVEDYTDVDNDNVRVIYLDKEGED